MNIKSDYRKGDKVRVVRLSNEDVNDGLADNNTSCSEGDILTVERVGNSITTLSGKWVVTKEYGTKGICPSLVEPVNGGSK